MTMLELWRKRLRQHQAQQFKYLRLVFNDHFVIAVIFLIGALALGYANVLKLIQQSYWWGPLVIAGIYTFVLSIGHLATLFESADSTFLLPKESDLFHYLVAARKYSLLVPTLVLILTGVAVFPFAMVIAPNFSLTSGITAVIALWILKDLQLWLEFLNCYAVPGKKTAWYMEKGYFYLISFIVLGVGVYVTPIISVIAALILNLLIRRNVTNEALEGQLKFQEVIVQETGRQFRILKIYNLFTDIPSLQRSAKRRKYLDWLVNRLPKNHKQSYLYLFGRGFLRGTEYLGFYMRFLVIGTLILFFIKQLWLAVILYLLLLYLSGFQLLPFYDQYDSIVFTKLYPVAVQDKLKSFQQLLWLVLGLQWLITSIPLLVTFGLTVMSGLMVLVGLIFTGAFILGYTQMRLKN